MFVCAWLLLQLQPIFARLALPALGGAPAVWTTALVLSQAGLLLGYLYSRGLINRIPARLGLLLHLVIMAAALLVSPVWIGPDWPTASPQPSMSWLVGFFAAAVGLPVLALAATLSLLQQWFARTGSSMLSDDRRLYVLGGFGAVAALVAYPFLIEPLLRLAEQRFLWTGLYAALIAVVAISGRFALRAKPGAKLNRRSRTATEAPPGWRRRLHWVALAFVPSGLLICAMRLIMTETAAASAFWALPLAIYALSFVLVFARAELLRQSWVLTVQAPLLLAAAIFATFTPVSHVFFAHALALGVLLFTGLACHGELVRCCPRRKYSTHFYICLLAGAFLGGAFAALLAPAIFASPVEYALLLVMAGLLRRPTDQSEESSGYQLATSNVARELSAPAAGLGIALLLSPRLGEGGAATAALFGIVVVFLLVFALLSSGRPIRFGLCVGVLALFGAEIAAPPSSASVHRARSALGSHQVKRAAHGEFLVYVHGTTVHGAQHMSQSRQRERHTYYHSESGVGRLFAALENTNAPKAVAAIGVGAGEIACYKQRNQHWTFYEADAAAAEIAGSGRFFQFLRQCAPEARIVRGNARIMLERERRARYDLLIVDAFAADATPIHLLTREALLLYLEKLNRGGTMLFHISHRHVDLEPVLAALAADTGLAARVIDSRPPRRATDSPFRYRSIWVAMGREPETLQALTEAFDASRPSDWGKWRELRARRDHRVWTDDYADPIGAIR